MKKNNRKYNEISRRNLLLNCAKMTGIGAMSSVINMGLISKVLAARPAGSINEYKGLVCVFLGGGCDSFNLLAPGNDEYATYLSARGPIARAQNDMHRIVDSANGDDYHLMGTMNGVRDIFEAGELSFIANLGTLVEPVTLSNIENARRPSGLYSHFDQRTQWQNSVPNIRGGSLAGTGWIGRMSEILNDGANNNAVVNANMSPAGHNLIQTSLSGRALSLDGGANNFELYNQEVDVRQSIEEDLEYQYASVLQNHYNQIRGESIDQNIVLNDIERTTTIGTNFPSTDIGNQLRQVAIYIKAHGADGLRANRQTFFVDHGSYDMHRGVVTRLPPMLSDLSDALTAFNDAMHEIGYHDRVVTYTASDFGRTLSANGLGSDHGWGGNNIVMGGPINGGQVLGNYPDIALGSSTDLGRGRVLPTTSIDQLHSSLAYWFGVDNNSEMEDILPNIRNFWARTNPNRAIPDSLNLISTSALSNRSA